MFTDIDPAMTWREFEWPEKACREHDMFLLYLLDSPGFARHRADKKWLDLERRMGISKDTSNP